MSEMFNKSVASKATREPKPLRGRVDPRKKDTSNLQEAARRRLETSVSSANTVTPSDKSALVRGHSDASKKNEGVPGAAKVFGNTTGPMIKRESATNKVAGKKLEKGM